MIYCNKCKAFNSEFTWYSDYIYKNGEPIGTKMTVCCAKCGSTDVKEVE
jgi:hypothetical protein